jgi:hypothetical protein
MTKVYLAHYDCCDTYVTLQATNVTLLSHFWLWMLHLCHTSGCEYYPYITLVESRLQPVMSWG